MAPPVLHHLTFLFAKTSVSLSLPPSTQISSLPSLILPALALTSLSPAPSSAEEFRVCKRVETAQDDVWDFRPLVGTSLTGKVGIWETLFLQFRDSESPDDWLPVEVSPPTNEEEDEDEDEDIEIPSLGDDDVPSGKGKGRATN